MEPIDNQGHRWDGLDDGLEYRLGTDPIKKDTEMTI